MVYGRSSNFENVFVRLVLQIYFMSIPSRVIVEQITVRIVQIMIQATDLAQILYGGH